MTPEINSPKDHRSSEEIQADIRETRGRMDATLDELGNRLTARSLLDSALEWWDSPQSGNQGSEAARSAVRTVARQIKHHPMPSLLIGSGIAWLISDSMDHDERPEVIRYDSEVTLQSYGQISASSIHGTSVSDEPGMMDKLKEGGANAKESAVGAVEAAKRKLSHVGDGLHHGAERMQRGARGTYDRSRTAASRMKHDLTDGYHRGARRFEGAVEEYPLAMGVAFAALGALAGLAIPRTRREDELLGEQSDHLIDTAKEKGSELLETGKKVGSRVLESAKQEAAEQGLTGDSVGQALSELAQKGGKVVEKAKEEAAHAAEQEGLKAKKPESNEGDQGNQSGNPLGQPQIR